MGRRFAKPARVSRPATVGRGHMPVREGASRTADRRPCSRARLLRGCRRHATIVVGIQRGARRSPVRGLAWRARNRTRICTPARGCGPGKERAHGHVETRHGAYDGGRIRKHIEMERRCALSSRDPIAIRLAAERYSLFRSVLAGLRDEAHVDMEATTFDLGQAARALSFNKREVKQLVAAGKLRSRKMNNEWRVPIGAVL